MIKLSFSNCPNMGDLKLVLAALELQPHSRAEMRKEELLEKEKTESQRIKNKSTEGATSLGEPRRLKGHRLSDRWLIPDDASNLISEET